ncbi:MAG: hypothetical protein ACK4N5_05740 [Myxococcales bacterium]
MLANPEANPPTVPMLNSAISNPLLMTCSFVTFGWNAALRPHTIW